MLSWSKTVHITIHRQLTKLQNKLEKTNTLCNLSLLSYLFQHTTVPVKANECNDSAKGEDQGWLRTAKAANLAAEGHQLFLRSNLRTSVNVIVITAKLKLLAVRFLDSTFWVAPIVAI